MPNSHELLQQDKNLWFCLFQNVCSETYHQDEQSALDINS